MPEIVASLGSNCRREYNIRSAVKSLRSCFGALRLSPVYRSKAVGFDGDDFLNMVISFNADTSPQAICRQFHRIEEQHGRIRGGEKMAARSLDIDLILHGEKVCDVPGLKLPADDITQYAFVLRPLSILYPQGVHPELGATYTQLWRDFVGDRELEVVDMQFD